jgi:type III restriction enzyme
VKHIFFIAETKGTMDSTELRPIEQTKISCARKLFNEIRTTGVKYHDIDSYQSHLINADIDLRNRSGLFLG